MRLLTISTAAAAILCSSAAFAAPLPSAPSGLTGALTDNVVTVKMKKKKMMMKKPMGGGMSSGGMKDGDVGGGQQMKGGTNSPVQGGGR